jgi:hypothetical protein
LGETLHHIPDAWWTSRIGLVNREAGDIQLAKKWYFVSQLKRRASS